MAADPRTFEQRVFAHTLPGRVEFSLSESEQQILDSVTSQGKKRLKTWKKDLAKERADIIGIRSEDPFFLLECLHRGEIPTTGHIMMDKGHPKNPDFFLTRNPESTYLHQRHLHRPTREKTFAEVAAGNVESYDYIGMMQSIYRDLIPFVHQK